MDQIALAIQNSVDGIGKIPADLTHPQPVCGSRDARDSTLRVDNSNEEQHDEALQPPPDPHFHGEETAATISSQCRLRNSFQVVFRLRSGAGSIPCRSRISAIVLRAISCPRLDNGRRRYGAAGRLLICADAGGSNSSRGRAWKVQLQALADEIGIAI